MKRWTSESGAPWFIRVSCATTVNGHHRTFSHLVPKETQADKGVTKWIEENLPEEFRGVMIHITTPLHHNIGIVDVVTGKFKYVMGPNG